MRLNSRSYPHPVLGNKDDVIGAAFQTTLEMSADNQFVYITTEVACSCEVLNTLLAGDRAEFVLHVECSNTLFRKAFEFHESNHRVSIPADNLNDTVEVNVFLSAKDNIQDYTLPQAHPDYGNALFQIRRGDILAVGEGQIFPVEASFDSLSRIGSIMQVSEAQEDGDIPMYASYEGDKVVIFLSKKDFADYKVLKQNETVRGPLTTTIVLPILIEALRVLKDEADADYSYRWQRALSRRIDNLNLKLDEDPLLLAQKLLDLPVKRTLSASRMVAEATL